jgi:hypothetical protein
MKKRLLFLFLTFALVVINMQMVMSQSGYVLNMPGGNVTTSKMAVPPLSSLITAYPFTVEMWVKPHAITAAGGFWVDRSGSVVSLQFTNDANGGLRTDIFGTTINGTALAAVKPAINVWHHLSMVVRSDSVLVECDGVFYAAANTKAFVSTFCSNYSHVGVDSSANNSTRTVNGLFDEVRIWNTARTRDEIKANKSVSLAGNETGLVAYYNFDGNNFNDKTANAKNAVVIGGTAEEYNAISTLSNVTLSSGMLVPAFSPTTTTYTINAPADVTGVTITGIAMAPGVATVGIPVILNASNTSATIICTSGNTLNTTTYTFNFVPLTLDDWDANGATGAGSYPNMWGWANTSTAIPWNGANLSGGCRYRDYNVSGGHTGFTNESDGSTSTSRQFMLRFDNAAYSASYYSFPVKLAACTAYDFDWDYVLGGSGTPPNTITIGIDTTKTGAGRLSSKTFTTTSSATVYRHGRYTFSTGSRGGVYYLTINAGVGAWYGITNLSLVASSVQVITTSPRTLALNDVTKSAVISVKGNALINDVTVTAPEGITLSRSTIPVGETQCGGNLTVTYDYSKNITGGNIIMTSGTLADTITFTYTKPTISVYEKNVEIENNGRYYPVNVKSIGNSVDSLFVSVPAGFTVAKNNFSSANFVSGSGSINLEIKSSSPIGTAEKFMFYTKQSGALVKLDSINVVVVKAYDRYYIKNKVSGLVIGDHNTGLYPALTVNAKSAKQKFYFRRVNIDQLASIDTFNIVQDDAYRVMRKVAASNWDTEFGIPSNEAKWTIQFLGADSVTFTNVVTNKVLGADAGTADSRLYDDKAYASGGRMVWLIAETSLAENATLSNLTSNGITISGFKADSFIYHIDIAETMPPVPTIVGIPTNPNAKVVITPAATIGDTTYVVVTAEDGITKNTYKVSFAALVGFNTIEQNLFKVYPTLSKGSFKVETKAKVGTITVYDRMGKIVSKKAIDATTQVIDVAKPGIYFIKIESAGFSNVVKVVKTN